MDSVEVSLVICRLVDFAATMLLFGAMLFRFSFRAAFAAAPAAHDAFDRWLRPLLVSTSVGALVSSAMWLEIEAVIMGEGWANALHAKTISTVLFQTEFGGAWSWHLAFGVVALALILSARGRLGNTRQDILLIGISAALVASAAWAGHAMMHKGAAGLAALTTQVIHLLAASAWLGSLPALAYVLYRARSDRQDAWRTTARYILPRYSWAGYAAVALILLTGCVNSWFMVDSIEALFSTTYGRILIAKIGLFILMVGVATFNRFVLMPKVLKPKSNTRAAEAAFRRLRRNVAIEQVLGLSIIAVVSVLGTVAPAMPGHMEM